MNLIFKKNIIPILVLIVATLLSCAKDKNNYTPSTYPALKGGYVYDYDYYYFPDDTLQAKEIEIFYFDHTNMLACISYVARERRFREEIIWTDFIHQRESNLRWEVKEGEVDSFIYYRIKEYDGVKQEIPYGGVLYLKGDTMNVTYDNGDKIDYIYTTDTIYSTPTDDILIFYAVY